MKHATLLLVLLLALAPAASLAPAAEARTYCTAVTDEACPGTFCWSPYGGHPQRRSDCHTYVPRVEDVIALP